MDEHYLTSLAVTVRHIRAALLAESDIAVLRAYETNTPVSQAWVDYRQALRDITSKAGFPENFRWPVKPE